MASESGRGGGTVSGLPFTLRETGRGPGSPPSFICGRATEEGRATLEGAPTAVLAKHPGGPRWALIRSITGA